MGLPNPVRIVLLGRTLKARSRVGAAPVVLASTLVLEHPSVDAKQVNN